MTKGKKSKNQQQTGVSKTTDTEFGTEFTQSKKARKRAAREIKNNS